MCSDDSDLARRARSGEEKKKKSVAHPPCFTFIYFTMIYYYYLLILFFRSRRLRIFFSFPFSHFLLSFFLSPHIELSTTTARACMCDDVNNPTDHVNNPNPFTFHISTSLLFPPTNLVDLMCDDQLFPHHVSSGHLRLAVPLLNIAQQQRGGRGQRGGFSSRATITMVIRDNNS